MKKLEKFAQAFMPCMMIAGLILLMVFSACGNYKGGGYAFGISAIVACTPALIWLIRGIYESEGEK